MFDIALFRLYSATKVSVSRDSIKPITDPIVSTLEREKDQKMEKPMTPTHDAKAQFVSEKALVFLLSGFLGSGKTTLLKRILSWQADLSGTVVLVNEFGDVGIDGALLEAAGSEIVELTSGCVCCTLSADLKKSLRDIQNRFHPKRIFIEATGIADPTAIIDALGDADLADMMTLEKIVTVLDADYWEARENFGALFYRQLESANLILLNKIDLVDSELIPQFLEEIHDLIPRCQAIPTIRCAIDPETLWAPASPVVGFLKPMKFFQEFAHNHSHHDDAQPSASQFVTFSFEDERIIDEAAFLEFMASLPWEVFRMKGLVRFPQKTRVINFVGGKGEWSDWNGDAVTRLAFIGWRADKDLILDRLAATMKSS